MSSNAVREVRKCRGRLAPSPSGLLHGNFLTNFRCTCMLLFAIIVGHAQTFSIAYSRCNTCNGELVLRIEDLDHLRCKTPYIQAIFDDLLFLQISWTSEVIYQSRRMDIYLDSWKKLLLSGWIYPCEYSRKDVDRAIVAPHEGEGEIVFPPSLRPSYMHLIPELHTKSSSIPEIYAQGLGVDHLPVEVRNLDMPTNSSRNWRFRVPDDEIISFTDNNLGPLRFQAGVDFGDFIVWRGSDHIPSYDFACKISL